MSQQFRVLCCVLLTQILMFSHNSHAAEWSPEFDTVPLLGNPGDFEANGRYAFVTTQADDQSRYLDIYKKTGNYWQLDQTLLPPPSTVSLRNFSVKSSISGDTALILLDENGLLNEENSYYDIDTSVGIYRNSTEGWALSDYLPIQPAVADLGFANNPSVQDIVLTENNASVSLTFFEFLDGEFLYTEAVAIYDRIDGAWLFKQILLIPEFDAPSSTRVQFGFDLDMTESTLAVSTVPYQANASSTSHGSVYLYDLEPPIDNEPPQWTLDRVVTQDASFGNATFGQQVDLVGKRLLVTATGFNASLPYDSEALAVYLYRQDDNGDWIDDIVFRSGDDLLTEFSADIYQQYEASFLVHSATLVDDQVYIWSERGFVGVGLKNISGAWTPFTLNQASADVYSAAVSSFSEIRVAEGSLIFVGRTQAIEDNGSYVVPPALIVFELECSSTKILPDNQWLTVSPPCLTTSNAPSVADVFDDDFSEDAIYNSDWVVFRFDQDLYDYVRMELDDTLVRGEGYWIIQRTGADITIDLPSGTPPATLDTDPTAIECVDSAKGCLSKPQGLFTNARDGFRMAGNPLNTVVDLVSVRVTASTPACEEGCNLLEGSEAEVASDILYRYTTGPEYDNLTMNDEVKPWDGFWFGTYEAANDLSPTLVFPLGE